MHEQDVHQEHIRQFDRHCSYASALWSGGVSLCSLQWLKMHSLIQRWSLLDIFCSDMGTSSRWYINAVENGCFIKAI